jgi:hypothetical protein
MQQRCHTFRLYVIGSAQKRNLGQRLSQFLTELYGQRHELEVIDLLEYPALAEQENIIATPLLVRTRSAIKQYITGDFTDRQRLERLLRDSSLE